MKEASFAFFFSNAFFGPKHQKTAKFCTSLRKLGSEKSSEPPIFIERIDVDQLLTLQCGPLIDPKTPNCGPLIDPTAHTHIYIYIYPSW